MPRNMTRCNAMLSHVLMAVTGLGRFLHCPTQQHAHAMLDAALVTWVPLLHCAQLSGAASLCAGDGGAADPGMEKIQAALCTAAGKVLSCACACCRWTRRWAAVRAFRGGSSTKIAG